MNRQPDTIIGSALLLAIFGLACSSHAGDITGTVTLKGAPPPETTVDLKSDAALAARYPQGLTTRHYRTSPNGGLQQVLVYLRDDFGSRTLEPPRTPAVLDHVSGLFQPHVMGVQVGQQLQLRCSDGAVCSFHTTPAANPAYSIAPLREVVTRTFTKSEVPIRFKCDLHPWNDAYVGVFPHPYFAVTGNEGQFTIRDVPPGQYTIEIFHPSSGKSSKEIVVPDGMLRQDFVVAPAQKETSPGIVVLTNLCSDGICQISFTPQPTNAQITSAQIVVIADDGRPQTSMKLPLGSSGSVWTVVVPDGDLPTDRGGASLISLAPGATFHLKVGMAVDNSGLEDLRSRARASIQTESGTPLLHRTSRVIEGILSELLTNTVSPVTRKSP